MVCGIVEYNTLGQKLKVRKQISREFKGKVRITDIGGAWYYEHYTKAIPFDLGL